MLKFYNDFSNQINNESLDTGQSQQEIFFEKITSYLIEEGVCNDAVYPRPPFRETGYQFDGYGGDPFEDDNRLTIFLIDYSFSESIEIILHRLIQIDSNKDNIVVIGGNDYYSLKKT